MSQSMLLKDISGQVDGVQRKTNNTLYFEINNLEAIEFIL